MKKIIYYACLSLLTFNLFAQEKENIMLPPNEMPSQEQPVVQPEPQGDVTTKSEFVPFMQEGNSQSYSQHSVSYQGSRSATVSCLDLMRQQNRGLSTDEVIKDNAARQTTGPALVGTGMSIGSGVAAGVITGNPVIGLAVGGTMELVTAIGTGIERKSIKNTGNLLSSSELILNGYDVDPKKKKIFNKMKQKVAKKAYGNKNALSDSEFASIVAQQDGLAYKGPGSRGEDLFCDERGSGRIDLISLNKKTATRRLADAALCNDSKKSKPVVMY